MGPEVANRNKDSTFYGDYVGRDNITVNIVMFQESEREFVVTHNANIKPVAYFTGRETELQDLRQRIAEGRKSVLVSGMGGIGKTHICRKLFEEYLREHTEEQNGPFRYIGYIEYDRDMDSSLQNCLKFKQQENPEYNSEAAWRELEHLASNGELLLFFDNVNVSIGEDEGLKRLMSIPGAIVLTSRRREFSKEFEPYRIGFLSTEKCRELYEKIRFETSRKTVTEKEVPVLEYIIDTLAARHTITVEFLAHLAKTKHWTVQKLRDKLEEKSFRLEYRDEEDKLVNIQGSYEILYDMSSLTETERSILEAFSIFPYIPLSAATCSEWLFADAGVSEEEDILTGLYQKGWLQFDEEQDSYALHPVFARFIYDKCKPQLGNHLELIEACRKRLDVLKSSSLSECQKYIPFAESMIIKLDMENNVVQAKFISALIFLLYYVAEYKKAEALCEKSLRIQERILGEEHPDTAETYNNLAFLYKVQGEYEKAKTLYEKSLRIREKVFGEEHSDTAVSYNNLAGVYMAQREYEKAEALCEKSLRIRERVLGEENPNTATGYNNLAFVYMTQGKYTEAKALYEKCLRILEKVLGEEHLYTATTYHNLAEIYMAQEGYGKAKELYEKCLRIRKKILGEEHPDTAASYNGLAFVNETQGEYQKAVMSYFKAYSILLTMVGADHPKTCTALKNMKRVYCAWNPGGDFIRWLEEQRKN